MNYRRKMIFSLRSQPGLIRDVIQNRVEEISRQLKEGPSKCVISDNSRRTPLHLACSLGRSEIVELFLQYECYSVNFRDADLVTPLHRACRNNHYETVACLLKYSADVNARSRLHITPLHVCCSFDAFECAQLIVKSVNNIDATDSNGYTALHHAVYRANLTMIELLLAHGASPEVQDKNGQRPIHFAAAANSPGAVLMLVKAGSDVNVRNKDLLTPLHIAIAYRSQKAFLALLELKANLEAQDIVGNMPSHWAAYTGCDAIFENIMKRVSVTIPNLEGLTPLHYASGSPHSHDVALRIMNSVPSVDVLSKYNRTPLHFAALYGREQTAVELIARGANVDHCDADLESPLHKAVANMHPGLVSLLIRKGAQVDIANKDGFTPLHYAVLAGFPSGCSVLISAGANPMLLDTSGRSAHYMAVHKGSLDSFICLMKSLHYHHLSSQSDAAKRYHVFNEFDAYKRTLLHYAAASKTCSHDFFEVLLLHRRLNAQEIKVAPEVLAAFEEAFSRLDINQRDEYGRTPLHYLCLRDVDIESDSGFLVELMIKSGADISLVDNENRLPFHYAVAKGYSTILDLLFNQKWTTKRADFDLFFLRNCPLNAAAFHGNCGAITKLVHFGFRNADKAIKIATRRNNWNCVIKLKQLVTRAMFQDLAMLTVMSGQASGFRIFLSSPNLDLTSLWFKAASSLEDTSCLEMLIDKHFNIQICDAKGRNALFYSVAAQNVDSTRILLAAGTRLVRDSIGKNVFHLMASMGNLSLLQMFHSMAQENGFYGQMCTYLLSRDDDGFSPMEVAIAKGHQAMLEFYVQTFNKGFEQKFMYFAGFTSNFTFVDFVYRKYGFAFLNVQSATNERTLLHYASMSKRNNLPLLQFLCEQLRFDVNAKDVCGLTPLLLAASVGNASTVEYLMSCTLSNLLAVDNENNNVLHLACQSGNTNTALAVMRLAESSKHLDTLIAAENCLKQTPLHLAAKKSLPKVLTELICRGASVNDADDYDYTPLMYCARDHSSAMCIQMISAIIELDLKNANKLELDDSVCSNTADYSTTSGRLSSAFRKSLLQPWDAIVELRQLRVSARQSCHSPVCDNLNASRCTSKGSLKDAHFPVGEEATDEIDSSDPSFEQRRQASISVRSAELPSTSPHSKDHADGAPSSEGELMAANSDNLVDSDSELY